jgi:acetyl-CoA carboxylase carboxyltransferase component
MAIDDLIPTARLREDLVRRFALYADKHEPAPKKKHLVPPV